MNGTNNLNYITWFSDEDFIYDFPWDDDNWGMSAGITAIRLAHVLYPNEVCNDNNVIPKVKNITEKDLWQHLEIDQKI